MKQTIGILGCGWLGFPLAQSLIQQGYRVKGTTTTVDKIEQLSAKGIEAFLLQVDDNETVGDWTSFFANLDVLLINFPPKLRNNPGASYVKKVEKLLHYIANYPQLKLIWVSSTSVFSDGQHRITDDTIPDPDTASGKELFGAEQCVKNSGHPFTIVRFGGLIGPNRHPIIHLSGRQNIERPFAPVNLIHLDDCISILHNCISREAIYGALNGVHPEHPSRKEYYTQAATDRNLPVPEFDLADERSGKCIHPQFLIESWNYTFQKQP